MKHKFLNTRISISFYNTLINHETFKNNWKAISPAFYFLNRISILSHRNNDLPVEFYHLTIKKIFQYYTRSNAYYKYLAALVELGLLVIKKNYRPRYNNMSGYCKQYLVTKLGVQLLCDCNSEYLKKLHTDRQTMRNNQKRISEHKLYDFNYNDYVLSYIYDGLVNFSYDYPKVQEIINQNNWPQETINSINNCLIDFKQKDFGPLKYNEADNRVFNEFLAMKSDIRTAFRYKNMTRKAIMDIRACHPTYFSSYLISLIEFKTTKTNTNTNTETSTTKVDTLHYVGSKSDKSAFSEKLISLSNLKREDFEQDLMAEHENWIHLFSNPAVDPREIIALELDKTKDEVKNELNQVLNGNRKYTKVINWIKEYYPVLFFVWLNTNTKETGPNISKNFETKIMTDKSIFNLADSLNIKLAYEYDGFSVFSEDENTVLLGKIQQITNKIKSISKEITGFECVLKTSFTA